MLKYDFVDNANVFFFVNFVANLSYPNNILNFGKSSVKSAYENIADFYFARCF